MTLKKPLVIALVAAAAAIAAYWFLLLTPKQEEAAALQTQITAKQGELDAARRQIAGYEQAKADYKANYATVARLGKAVPADDDVRSLMVQVDAAAGRAGVRFKSLDVSAPATSGEEPLAGGFTQVPFSFTFTGKYFELADFVRRLERFVSITNDRVDVTGRLLQVSSVQLAPAAGGFPHIQAQVAATSYRLAPGQAAMPGSTPPGGGTGAAAGTPASSATPSTPTTTTATVTGAVR